MICFMGNIMVSWNPGGVRGVSSLTMNETRDPYPRFVQGWLKTDKGSLRAYPGLKG